MSASQPFIVVAIQYTRLIALLLSGFVVVSSLSQYSHFGLSFFSVLAEDTQTLATHPLTLLQEAVQDKRLISTLVAVQASIMCPFFLLYSQSEDSERPSAYNTAVDLVCQFFLPLGLSLSWLFCVMFDHKLTTALINSETYQRFHPLGPPACEIASWMPIYRLSDCSVGSVLTQGSKYALIGVFLLEAMAVWIAIFQHGATMTLGSIRLPVDEESNGTLISDTKE